MGQGSKVARFVARLVALVMFVAALVPILEFVTGSVSLEELIDRIGVVNDADPPTSSDVASGRTPPPKSPASESQKPVQPPAVQTPLVLAGADGSWPASAVFLSGSASGALESGQKCWYWFMVQGNNAEGVHPRTHLTIAADAPDSAVLEIWTLNDLQEWEGGVMSESEIPTFRGKNWDDDDCPPGKYWARVVARARTRYQLYLSTTWDP